MLLLLLRSCLACGLVLLPVVVLSSGPTWGATLTVCASGCDYSSIQDAVNAADVTATTVSVLPGVYVENIRITGKEMILASTSGPAATVLDGGGAGSVLQLGELSDVTIDGFTIRNAGGTRSFTENGYGIVVTPFTTARATILGNLITNNNLRGGIGIISGRDLEIDISGNLVMNNFRGIELQLSTAISTVQGFLNVTNNVVAFNQVDPGNPSGSGMALIGCCPFGTPGPFSLNVVNNTIYGNRAVFGGGLAANISNLVLKNNILFANTASQSGADLYMVQAALTATVSFNIIGDGQFPIGNSASDPKLLDPTAGDFHLVPGSPAIDAGDNLASSLPLRDLEGDPRIIDGDRDGNPVVDIGADELVVASPPLAVASSDQAVECSSHAGGSVTLDGSESTDPDSTPGTNDDIALFEWFENFGTASVRLLGPGETLDVTLPLGVHDITLRVTDRAGATSTDATMVSVVDTTSPTLAVSLSPTTLWPPNHRMVKVTADVTAADACGESSVQLASVTSSDPDDAPGVGDGSTVNDIQDASPGTADFDLQLRAERAGEGNGRLYSLVYRATDGSGNVAERTALLLVPHDQAGVTEPVQISLRQDGAGTVVDWNSVAGALYYDVIRGRLSDIREGASEIKLGGVTCVEAGSLDTSNTGMEDSELPKPGEIFFYLVQFSDGWTSSYGEPSAGKPRVVGSGGCH